MQARHGGFLFPPKSTEVVRSAVTSKKDRYGAPIETTWTYQVTTTLVCPLSITDKLDRQRWYSARENEIRQATAVPGQDFALLDDAGLPTDVSLFRAAARRGPFRTSFQSPQGGKSEFAGMRTVSFTLEAVYPNAGTAGALVSFSETYRISGLGGPTRVLAHCQDVIEEQEPSGVSISRAYQSGEAVGYLGVPLLGPYLGCPAPKFPRGFRPNQAEITKKTPQEYGVSDTDWFLAWSYYSESGTPYTF